MSRAWEGYDNWDSLMHCSYGKVALDKLYGCMWHVVAGEEFSFDLTFEVSQELHVEMNSVPR